MPFYDLQREDAAPLEVIIRFELPAPIRVPARRPSRSAGRPTVRRLT